jgi:hypothetical protein
MNEEKQGLPRRTADRSLLNGVGAVRFPVVSHVSPGCFAACRAYRQLRTKGV